MADFTIDISKFKQDFGVAPRYQLPEPLPKGTEESPFSGVETSEQIVESFDGQPLMSVFGTPILGAVKIDNLLLEHCMFTISGSNHIIKTKTVFIDGTVNEYFAQNDYAISLRGYLIGGDYNDVLELCSELNRLCRMNSSHEVNNALMKEMQIDRLVIDTWKVIPVEGGENYTTFQINATSERPIELNIKEL